MFETRKEGVDFDFCKKKKKLSKNGRLGVSSLSVLQKQQKRNISENIFAPQSLI